MRTLAALLAAVPLAAFAQAADAPPPSPAPAPAAAQPAPAPAPQYAPPAYVPPPPQSAPPAYAPPPQYAPPAYAPPPPQYAPPAYVPPQAGPAPAPTYAPPERRRDSWYIGFGLGPGNGSVKIAGESLDLEDMVFDDATTFSMNFRVGATVSPNLLFGFDGGFTAASASDGGYDSSVQLNYYDAGIMYFPMGRGLYLRGAAGLSSIVWEVDGYGDADASGFNVLGGAGYAFWLGRSFNLTVNADVVQHFFSEDDLESGTAYSLWVGFDWY